VRDFAVYTGLRLALFAVAFGLFWLVLHDKLAIFPILLLALIASAIASVFVLRNARERFAGTIDARARRMTKRFEEARRAEDGE
jgi:CHASE1-domain containing sensor protein